jgi:hypothetical protein
VRSAESYRTLARTDPTRADCGPAFPHVWEAPFDVRTSHSLAGGTANRGPRREIRWIGRLEEGLTGEDRVTRPFPTARPTPRSEQTASRRGWRRWEAVRFLCPLEYLAAGWSERRSPQERPHEEVAPCPHCKDACRGRRPLLDTVIRTFAPGRLLAIGCWLSAIGYRLSATSFLPTSDLRPPTSDLPTYRLTDLPTHRVMIQAEHGTVSVGRGTRKRCGRTIVYGNPDYSR